jgi:hypothetical protein
MGDGSVQNAEVLSVIINRGGLSLIRIHTWNLRPRADRRGHFAREREAIVVFEFEGIKSLRLHGEDADRTSFTGRKSKGPTKAIASSSRHRWARWRTDRGADCSSRRAGTLSRFWLDIVAGDVTNTTFESGGRMVGRADASRTFG